jgi:hypothetical protein
MRLGKFLPRFLAAVLFAATASTAVVVTDATHTGQPATSGILSSAPQAASAAVSIGIGFGVGPHPYYRYGWRGGAWVRFGYGYAYAPGWVNGFYLGYAAPVYGYPYYYARGYRPYFWGVHPYYGGYYGRGYYGRGYGYGYHSGVSVGVSVNSAARYNGWRR